MTEPAAKKSGGSKVDFSDLQKLLRIAITNKAQMIKCGGIEIVLHPTAFIELPKEMQPAIADKLKLRQETSAEDEELLFHSA